MDLHYSQTNWDLAAEALGFTTLWIYTILKRVGRCYNPLLLFHYLMDLHYSQTGISH